MHEDSLGEGGQADVWEQNRSNAK